MVAVKLHWLLCLEIKIEGDKGITLYVGNSELFMVNLKPCLESQISLKTSQVTLLKVGQGGDNLCFHIPITAAIARCPDWFLKTRI